MVKYIINFGLGEHEPRDSSNKSNQIQGDNCIGVICSQEHMGNWGQDGPCGDLVSRLVF